MSTLDGQVAVVTGTSRGIGLAIALELLKEGATVIGCSRTELDALAGAESIEGGPERSAHWACDQTDVAQVDNFVQRVVDTYGRIDILVNNAGGTIPVPETEDVPEVLQRAQRSPRTDDEFERTALFHQFSIQMNLTSPLWFAIRVFRQMRTQEGTGSIINISSGAGHSAGSPSLVSYGAAKAGLDHMTRSLATEWGPHARVNCLALGPTLTDSFRSFVLPKDDPTGKAYFSAVPLGRGAEPSEIGRAVVFLCGPDAQYISGSTIEIDGGTMPGSLNGAGLETIRKILDHKR